MKFLKVSSFVSVFALAASGAMAAPILIDGFTDFQIAADTPTSSASSPSFFGGGSMIGGSRVFEVVNAATNPGSGGVTLTSTGSGQPFQVTPENTLALNAGLSQRGVATVTYDGRASLADIPTGFAPVDLTDNGTNAHFFFDLVQDTPNFVGTTLTTTVTDALGGNVEFVEPLNAGFSPFTAFASFAGIDFTQVTSLTFSLDTNELNGFNGGIFSISAVPLPLSSLLLLGGLGGVAGARSMSKRRHTA